MSIKLHPNAVFYFVLKRAFGLILIGSLFVLILLSKCDATVQSTNVHVTASPGAGLFFGTILGFLLLSIVLIYAGVQWLYCRYLVRSYSIEFRKDGVLLQSGVFNTSNELLLFTKIQDIVINRGILERMMGLSTVLIQNAGGRPQRISGLGSETAIKFREEILNQINR